MTQRSAITRPAAAIAAMAVLVAPTAPAEGPRPILAIAHGTGGSLGLRHGSATVILERE